MTPNPRLRHLPMILQPLDLEQRTKPVGIVICPRRGDILCVGVCSQCPGLRRIDLSASGDATLRCEADATLWDTSHTVGGDVPRLRDLVRMPAICVARDTMLSALSPLLGLVHGSETIPVLDERANPVGVVYADRLSRLLREGIDPATPVSSLMNTRFPLAYPHTTIADAMHISITARTDTLLVVGFDGTLLGVVERTQLQAAQPQA